MHRHQSFDSQGDPIEYCYSVGSTDASSGCSSPRTLIRPSSTSSSPVYLQNPYSSGHTSPVNLQYLQHARHGSMSPEVPNNLGGLAIFSFVSAESNLQLRLSFPELQHRLREAVANSALLRGGMLLDSREKGVLFPMVHFTEDKEILKMRLHQHGTLLDDKALGSDWHLQQGVYREVRNIIPDRSPGHETDDDEYSYILIGFKSLDTTFSQVMVDSWKDWTGARSIYLNLPDELGLSRISFFHRETPEDVRLFMYVVLVECRSAGTPERACRLLDFTQRLRVERMAGYVSVYAPLRRSTLESSASVKVLPPVVQKHGHKSRNLLQHLNASQWAA
ncbi:uncharacterized protein LOC135942702 [Cloeon dipterum]|uniref:DUF7153 domain-containing protein n=1 Tax=Cloeon dipterum TaxID=197152 RepID=A0A8S1CMH8_9INSE|nr:Hypothetical predicted protein [Cloeon dipterum]